MKKSYRILLFSILFFGVITITVSAQQSNFSIAPSPIPYPYFDDGWSDITVDGSYIGITASQMSMNGGFIGLKGRGAMAGVIAIDAGGNLGMLTGSMPGIPPMAPIYTNGAYSYVPYYTQVAGRASLSFLNFSGNLGLEIQPIRTDVVDMILFGGFIVNMSTLTITTPYNRIVPLPYSNHGQVYTGYTDTLTISSTPYGYQAGVQLDLTLSENVRLSPFVMMNSVSGSATMTDNPGAGASTKSYSVTIPRSTSYSFGMDILFDDFSIGTLLQQLQSAGKNNSSAKIVMINMQYHFLTSGEKKSDTPEPAAEIVTPVDETQKSK